jgi:hypothetical protein
MMAIVDILTMVLFNGLPDSLKYMKDLMSLMTYDLNKQKVEFAFTVANQPSLKPLHLFCSESNVLSTIRNSTKPYASQTAIRSTQAVFLEMGFNYNSSAGAIKLTASMNLLNPRISSRKEPSCSTSQPTRLLSNIYKILGPSSDKLSPTSLYCLSYILRCSSFSHVGMSVQ